MFYKKFKEKSDKELLSILDDSTTYTNQALVIAAMILEERSVELTEKQQDRLVKVTARREKEEKKVNKENLSPFVRRAIASIIDQAILLITSILLKAGLILFGINIGVFEISIGFVLIMVYYVPLNSSIGTIGKTIMKIQVLHVSGRAITLSESFIRTSVLFGPYYLIEMLDELNFEIFGSILALQISYFGSMFYFVISDKFRRNFHDRICHTIVESVVPDELFVKPKSEKSLSKEYEKVIRK